MQVEKNIDIQRIIGEVTDDVLQNMDRFSSSDNLILYREYIADRIWANMLDTAECSGDAVCNPACTAAEIIHSGIQKENVTFRYGKYSVLLNGSKFILKRKNDGKTTTKFSIPGMNITSRPHAVQIDAKELAALMLAFDAALDDISLAITGVEEILKQRMLEQDKEDKARQILMETIRTLITECVKPLGLQSSYRVDNGVVHLSLSQLKKAEMDIPIEELAERLRDSETIIAALKTVEKEDYDNPDDVFGSIPRIHHFMNKII